MLTPAWAGLCTFWDPKDLSNELSDEAGSISCCLTLHRFFQSEVLRLYFPLLKLWVARPVWLPSCSSWFMCTQMWDHPLHQPLFCHESPSPQLPIPTSPTGLDECSFFNSLVVGLPYCSIFCQFWLFFVFKFVVALLLVV